MQPRPLGPHQALREVQERLDWPHGRITHWLAPPSSAKTIDVNVADFPHSYLLPPSFNRVSDQLTIRKAAQSLLTVVLELLSF